MSSRTLSHHGESHLILEQSNSEHKSVLNKLKDGKKCDPREFQCGDQFYVAYYNNESDKEGYLWYWGELFTNKHNHIKPQKHDHKQK